MVKLIIFKNSVIQRFDWALEFFTSIVRPGYYICLSMYDACAITVYDRLLKYWNCIKSNYIPFHSEDTRGRPEKQSHKLIEYSDVTNILRS